MAGVVFAGGSPLTQDTIRAGDSRLVHVGLPERVDTLTRSLVRDGKRTDWGDFTRAVTRTYVGGEEAYLVVSRAPVPGGKSLDTLIIRSRSLAPLSFSHRTPRVIARWTYSGSFVAGTFDDSSRPEVRVPVGEFIVPGSSRQRIAAQLFNEPFDGAALELLVPHLPLREGYEVAVPIFDLSGERFVLLSVTGSESLDREGEKTDCWVVQSGTGADGPATLYWIGKDSRIMLRSTVSFPGGMEIVSILK